MSNAKLKPSRATLIRTAVLAIALINQIIVIFGGDALPFSDSQIYQGVTCIITVGASILTWWKNNSLTQPALKADLKLAMYKRDKATRS